MHYGKPIAWYCGKTVSHRESAISTFYRLPIVTMSPSAAVSQFSIESFKLLVVISWKW